MISSLFRLLKHPAFRLASSVTAESFSSLREVTNLRDLITMMTIDHNSNSNAQATIIGTGKAANQNAVKLSSNNNSCNNNNSSNNIVLETIATAWHWTVSDHLSHLLVAPLPLPKSPFHRHLSRSKLVNLWPFRHRTARTTWTLEAAATTPVWSATTNLPLLRHLPLFPHKHLLWRGSPAMKTGAALKQIKANPLVKLKSLIRWNSPIT